jgi:iron complex outermembrane receptor protein
VFGPTAASFAVLVLAANGAFAQESIETVTVTGFRASITQALDIKQKSQDLVEAISSEDLGKLPEYSIADSLARLPGLSAQRSNNGHWQDISINGLPPSMSATLFNGRPQASTDNNRIIQFDQYPSELMSTVKVYKTGDAALTNGAIATVDLTTIRPLDYDKTAFVVSVQGEYDTRGALQPEANAKGGRVNVSYVDQFANDKLGVMLGVATMSAPNQIYSSHPWGYNTSGTAIGAPNGLQSQVRSDTLARTGVIGTVQWKPINNLNIVVDGFYSRYDDDTIIRGIEFALGTPDAGSASGNTYGTWSTPTGANANLVSPQIENRNNDSKSKQYSFGTSLEYTVGSWSLKGDVGFSEADRSGPRMELNSGINPNGTSNSSTATISYGTGAGGMIGVSNWSLPIVGNPNIGVFENLNWSHWYPDGWPNSTLAQTKGTGWYQDASSVDAIRDTTWSLRREIGGFFSDVEVGFSYTARSKDYVDFEGAAALTTLSTTAVIPSRYLLAPTHMSAFGLPDTLSVDLKSFFANEITIVPRPDAIGQAYWLVKEKVFTPYVITRIDTTLFGLPLTGNAGAQFVHTDQAVTTNNQVGDWPSYTYTPVTDKTEYWDILPSMNLTWQVADDQQIRLGVGRSMARPRFDTMGGHSTISFSAAQNALGSFPWSGTAANPALKPWYSDDVDASYEWYYAEGEALFIEGFYKNLESFIYNKNTTIDFHSYAYMVPTGMTVTQWSGEISSYANGDGGDVEGVVVGGNFLLSHISHWLDGFGIQAQATVLSSSVVIPDANTSPNHQIPELSKFSGNLTFYYEKDNFSVRINDRYRSKYVQEVPNFDGTLQSIEGAAEENVDVQISYKMDPLTFSFSAENVTDTPMNSFLNGNARQPSYYKLFGTNLLFGVSYKY